MKRPALARRREVWIPTVWGWLTILAASCLAFVFVLRHIPSFLAPNRPVGARLMVVEGWMPPDELDQAVAAFHSGGYERIVTTGGPIPQGFERLGCASFAELARDFLLKRGLQDGSVIAIPAPASAQDRSFLNAVMLREWAKQEGLALDALDLFSSGVHSRRSWVLYQMALGPTVRVGILAARPGAYDLDAWWRTSVGAKTVLSETIGWIWTELFFRPGAPGSHEEKWGDPRVTPRPAASDHLEAAPGSGAMGR
jgi:hypothetical protein